QKYVDYFILQGLDEQRLTDLIQAVELIYVNKTMSNVIEKTVEEFYAHHSFQTFIRACLIPMMYLLKRQQNLDLIVNNIVLELMDTTNGLNQDILKNVRTLTALCHPIDRDALKHQLLRLSNDEYRQFYRDTSESTRSLKQILFEAIRDGNMTDYFRIYSEFIEICKYRTQLTRIDVYGSSSKELFSLQGKLPQSSGKSTLLNYMFGTLFDVREGQCIYDTYDSVVKANSSDFDYILLIDSGGLLSIERGDREYD
ncbi:unnamed protein product, partial [Didymodactylos carnosus]